jgi:hypothetical protein
LQLAGVSGLTNLWYPRIGNTTSQTRTALILAAIVT